MKPRDRSAGQVSDEGSSKHGARLASIHKHLIAYSAVAAAATASSSEIVSAEVVTTQIPDLVVEDPYGLGMTTYGRYVGIDVNGDGIDDFSLVQSHRILCLSCYTIYDRDNARIHAGTYYQNFTPNRVVDSSGGDVAKLGLGDTISLNDPLAHGGRLASRTNSSYTDRSGGNFLNAKDAYIGLIFEIPDPGGVNEPTRHTGFMRVSLAGAGRITLHEVGYETEPDTALTIPGGEPVPEPTSLGVLALGVVGINHLRSHRRRRCDPTVGSLSSSS